MHYLVLLRPAFNSHLRQLLICEKLIGQSALPLSIREPSSVEVHGAVHDCPHLKVLGKLCYIRLHRQLIKDVWYRQDVDSALSSE